MASPIMYPHWKKHPIGNFFQLDEDVTIDKFRKETNFDGVAYYDPLTKYVIYYSTLEHHLELNHYKDTYRLQSAALDYIDNDAHYVL